MNSQNIQGGHRRENGGAGGELGMRVLRQPGGGGVGGGGGSRNEVAGQVAKVDLTRNAYRLIL